MLLIAELRESPDAPKIVWKPDSMRPLQSASWEALTTLYPFLEHTSCNLALYAAGLPKSLRRLKYACSQVTATPEGTEGLTQVV